MNEYQHWLSINKVLGHLISECNHLYGEVLSHYGTYVIYEDNNGFYQVLHVEYFRQDHKVVPYPRYWFNRLKYTCLLPIKTSDEKYAMELDMKTIKGNETYSIPDINGQIFMTQNRIIKSPYRVIKIIEENMFEEQVIKSAMMGYCTYQALANKYCTSSLHLSNRIEWIDESMAYGRAKCSKSYVSPSSSKGVYVCMDKKILSIYVGNALLYDHNETHWYGDDYDVDHYKFCFADVLFLKPTGFISTQHSLMKHMQRELVEDERYIWLYITKEQWESITMDKRLIFQDLEFRNGDITFDERPNCSYQLII